MGTRETGRWGDIRDGYLTEQVNSFIAAGALLAARRIEEHGEIIIRSPESELMEMAEFDETIMRQTPGIVAGLCQDVACLAGSVAYLCGNDSKLAAISAGIIGAKLAVNLLSAAGVYAYYAGKIRVLGHA